MQRQIAALFLAALCSVGLLLSLSAQELPPYPTAEHMTQPPSIVHPPAQGTSLNDHTNYLPLLAREVAAQPVGSSCDFAALREAVAAGGSLTFNCGPTPHTIVFDHPLTVDTTTVIDGGNLIIFNGDERTALFEVAVGQELVLKNVRLQGARSAANGAAVVARENASLTVHNTQFENNASSSDAVWCGGGGAIAAEDNSTLTILSSSFTNNQGLHGGAVLTSFANVTIDNSTFTNNRAWLATRSSRTLDEQLTQARNARTGICAGGGALFADGGRLTVRNSRFDNNMTNQHGGAAFVSLRKGQTVSVVDSSFAGNQAQRAAEWSGTGGALWLGSGSSDETGYQVAMQRVTFANNSAAWQGGAIWTRANLWVENGTFVGNHAINPAISDTSDWRRGSGGALRIDSDALVRLDSVTLAGNRAGYHGGGISSSPADSGGASIRNTLIANNVAEWAHSHQQNCTDAVTNWGHNLHYVDGTAADSGCGDTLTFGHPRLGALADNGGRVQTLALQAGSAAIDAGNNNTCPADDARAHARPQGTHCDIGAYESVGIATATPAPTDIATITPSSTPTPWPTQTSSPWPTNTPSTWLTNTPWPTNTPRPTNTPSTWLTNTPWPTNTPRPTMTPWPPQTLTVQPTATPIGTPPATSTPAPTMTPFFTPTPSVGDRIVGDGTPGSCTEPAFAAALALGGSISFDCGPTPHTIWLTQEHEMLLDTDIDGGGLITLDGNHQTGLLRSEEHLTIILRNIALKNGHSHDQGAAINVGFFNAFEAYHVTFEGNTSTAEHAICDGGGAIFIGGGGTAHIEHSTFRYNVAPNGGAINNLRSALTILDSTFENNSAWHSAQFNLLGNCGGGGAVYFDGTRKPEDNGPDDFIIRNSTFTNNITNNVGGALFIGVRSFEDVIVEDTTFQSNRAELGPASFYTGLGGAVWIGQGVGGQSGYRIRFERVGFVDNHSESQGGALWTRSPMEMINVTFYDNSAINPNITDYTNWRAGNGGAITAGDQAQLTLKHATIVSNTAGFNGGGLNGENIILVNSLVAYNVGRWTTGLQQNCTHHAQNWGGNLQFLSNHADAQHAWDSNCGPTIDVADPLVLPLQTTSTLMLTAPLAAGSPAIDGLVVGSFCPQVDQRGVARPKGFGCDSGAFEFE